MDLRIWKPAVFHGGRQDRQFFEGWYFKLVTPDQQERWAIIPGVFHHPEPALRHAFIQILDGIRGRVRYHRFPLEAFWASSREFEIRIAGSTFHGGGLSLLVEDPDQSIRGDVSFSGLSPWPVTLLSPGVMGPYRFAPLMQTYHGVLSMDHTLRGMLQIGGQAVDFDGGRGYIEKDWGRTFPRAYIWMQGNHFPDQGISLTASVATIPWLTGWFRGFLAGLLVDGRLYRFTTYLGSKIRSLTVDDQHVNWVLSGRSRSDPERRFSSLELSIRAERSKGGLLSSPELDGMTPRILESLTAEIEIELRGFSGNGGAGEIIYQGRGACAGLEIAGSITEITDQKAE